MNSEMLKKKAINYLMHDEISNIDMLEPIRRGVADIIYAADDGVIILEKISEALMAHMDDLKKFKSLINIENYNLFAVHQKDMAQWIKESKNLNDDFEAYQAVYMKKELIEGDFSDIRNLSLDYTDIVCKNYHSMDDTEYIQKLISKGHMWGIFEGNEMAGFAGIHSEGSMGLLEIFPEHRRKGYGYKLEAFLINYFLENGRIPFCQVIAGNENSFALQKKVGMEISKETTIWIF